MSKKTLGESIEKEKEFSIGDFCIARVHTGTMTEGREPALCIICEIDKDGFRKVLPIDKDDKGYFYGSNYWRLEPVGRLKKVDETDEMRAFAKKFLEL